MLFLLLCLTSLSETISGSIHSAANGIISFFLIAEQHPLVYMYHIFFIRSSFNGHLALFTVAKTLESPLDCKEIQPVHSEQDQPWDFFGRNDAEAETPLLWPPHVKS